jgi:hypothetical protein
VDYSTPDPVFCLFFGQFVILLLNKCLISNKAYAMRMKVIDLRPPPASPESYHNVWGKNFHYLHKKGINCYTNACSESYTAEKTIL